MDGPPPQKAPAVYVPPPPPDWVVARQRQAAPVQADPKYILDTGFGFGCPQCGSTNLINLGKPTSGLSYFGGFTWVVGMSLLEGALSQFRSCVLQCNYCNVNFKLG
jgi:hypothetical protein